jgi:hypothetical protein
MIDRDKFYELETSKDWDSWNIQAGKKFREEHDLVEIHERYKKMIESYKNMDTDINWLTGGW